MTETELCKALYIDPVSNDEFYKLWSEWVDKPTDQTMLGSIIPRLLLTIFLLNMRLAKALKKGKSDVSRVCR